MKNRFRILTVCLAFTILGLTSCHKSGCPGKITDTDTQVELQKDC